jgi:hypothetical protein
MLKYEVSRWTIELLGHHFATGFVMSVAITGEKFTGYAYWSLLMEVNRFVYRFNPNSTSLLAYFYTSEHYFN